MITVRCANGQCGQRLGVVGRSARSGNPQPVWKIQPGWTWKQGVLEYIDETFRAERRLYHEVTGGPRPEGMAAFRECDIPPQGLVVRCPRCHRLRMVMPDVVFAGNPG